jgi:hypothetical protein
VKVVATGTNIILSEEHPLKEGSILVFRSLRSGVVEGLLLALTAAGAEVYYFTGSDRGRSWSQALGDLAEDYGSEYLVLMEA